MPDGLNLEQIKTLSLTTSPDWGNCADAQFWRSRLRLRLWQLGVFEESCWSWSYLPVSNSRGWFKRPACFWEKGAARVIISLEELFWKCMSFRHGRVAVWIDIGNCHSAPHIIEEGKKKIIRSRSSLEPLRLRQRQRGRLKPASTSSLWKNNVFSLWLQISTRGRFLKTTVLDVECNRWSHSATFVELHTSLMKEVTGREQKNI